MFPCCRNNQTETILIATILVNGSGVFLASSYILNYPISINLCLIMRLWLPSKFLASFSFSSYMVSLWLLIPSLLLYFCLDFLLDFTLLSHWPKKMSSSIKKSKTYTEGNPTSTIHYQLHDNGVLWVLYILVCFMQLPFA